mmetsp:Transcript_63553/g.200796  ORF Transcript_63553/g.200796 Transcript_63553/m.200796 type:complete len:200 (-) Transcript_63553:462-1061(-)
MHGRAGRLAGGTAVTQEGARHVRAARKVRQAQLRVAGTSGSAPVASASASGSASRLPSPSASPSSSPSSSSSSSPSPSPSSPPSAALAPPPLEDLFFGAFFACFVGPLFLPPSPWILYVPSSRSSHDARTYLSVMLRTSASLTPLLGDFVGRDPKKQSACLLFVPCSAPSALSTSMLTLGANATISRPGPCSSSRMPGW